MIPRENLNPPLRLGFDQFESDGESEGEPKSILRKPPSAVTSLCRNRRTELMAEKKKLKSRKMCPRLLKLGKNQHEKANTCKNSKIVPDLSFIV